MKTPNKIWMFDNSKQTIGVRNIICSARNVGEGWIEYIRADLCRPEWKLEPWRNGYGEDKSAKRKSNS